VCWRPSAPASGAAVSQRILAFTHPRHTPNTRTLTPPDTHRERERGRQRREASTHDTYDDTHQFLLAREVGHEVLGVLLALALAVLQQVRDDLR
jgi:hypothetical protein